MEWKWIAQSLSTKRMMPTHHRRVAPRRCRPELAASILRLLEVLLPLSSLVPHPTTRNGPCLQR